MSKRQTLDELKQNVGPVTREEFRALVELVLLHQKTTQSIMEVVDDNHQQQQFNTESLINVLSVIGARVGVQIHTNPVTDAERKDGTASPVPTVEMKGNGKKNIH